MRRYCSSAVVSMFSSISCVRCSLFCCSSLVVRSFSIMPFCCPERLMIAFSSITLCTSRSREKPLSKISMRILKPTYLPAGLCIAMCTKANIIAVTSHASSWPVLASGQ